MEVTASAIEGCIQTILNLPQNALKGPCDAAFPMPLIGYVRGDSPLLARADGRKIHSAQWLEAKFGADYTPDRICIISWALPIPEEIRVTMRGRRSQPSLDWMIATGCAERINLAIARAITALLNEQRMRAVSPLAEMIYQRMTVEKYGAALDWSESAAAVAAGIAARRFSRGIMTAAGACVALGSVIAAAPVPSAARVAPLPMRCRMEGGCTACWDRCPARAISASGVDDSLCLKYQSQFVLPYLKARYGFQGKAACDLCMTDIPCEGSLALDEMGPSEPN